MDSNNKNPDQGAENANRSENKNSGDNAGNSGNSGGKGNPEGKNKRGGDKVFKASTPGLESCIFSLRGERTNAPSYSENIEHLRLYVQRTYEKSCLAMRTLFETSPTTPTIQLMTHDTPLPPPPPTETAPEKQAREANEKVIRAQDEKINEKFIKLYVESRVRLEADQLAFFDVIIDQCSKAMTARIKESQEYSTKRNTADCIWLLQRIRGLMTPNDPFVTAAQALIQLTNVSQSHHQNTHSVENYVDRLRTLDHHLVSLGGATISFDTKLDPTATGTDEEKQTTLRRKFLGRLAIMRADPTRFAELKEQLGDSYATGRNDCYPDSLEAAQQLLTHFNGKKRNQKEISGRKAGSSSGGGCGGPKKDATHHGNATFTQPPSPLPPGCTLLDSDSSHSLFRDSNLLTDIHGTVIVDDVKSKIKDRGGAGLRDDFDGNPLSENETLPVGTGTYEKPLLPRIGVAKKARVCFSFDDSLPKPSDVIPPKSTKPEFVAPDGWLDEVEDEIVAQMQRSDELVDSDTGECMGDTEKDGDETLNRVAPMAVVRCSRGGKTRALYEIANKMRGYNPLFPANIASLYISFNDYSSLWPWEQENPLQALLRRIVFMASHNNARKRNGCKFADFLNKKEHIEPKDFLKWLGDSWSTPCVLIVDELNNLHELSKENSPAATEFAQFVKRYFIAIPNRYFVFSSHKVSTLEYFSLFVNPGGSVRSVVLQKLPITDSLRKALKLKPGLDSAREAIYYGLLPGLIYESKSVRSIVGKRESLTHQFLSDSQNLDKDFRDILRSLLHGDSKFVPEQLHMLLDSAGNKDGQSVIRWVPFHLSFVMSRLAQADSFSDRVIAGHMGKLCESIRDSKRFSGDSWEALFVLFLLARCLTGSHDEYFVPSKWFLEKPKVFFNEPYQSDEQRLFSECENWNHLLDSVTPGATTPQLSILFPTHSSFATYDVLVVHSKDGENKSIYGYKLKEGTASTAHSAIGGIEKRFWIQGKSSKNAREQGDWVVPDSGIIDNFYGESGKRWTPEQWRKFEATK